MLDLTCLPTGVILPVRATPSANRNAITGIHDGMLKITLTAPPDDGRANAAIVALLAKSLKISKSRVQLLSGATQRQKKFLLVDVDPTTVASLG
ncbi:MAG: DUF167 domain-containing protein [Planctomycetales bacterium]|nr:DUF167 domain-containing protein [Planctomycetales bacterium]